MTVLACPGCFQIRNRVLFNVLKVYKRTVTNKWNILFFGTDNFSLKSLKRIHNEYVNDRLIDKLEVVTNTASRHTNAISKFATENKLRLHPWPLTTLSKGAFDVGIVVSFGHLIPEKVINKFPLGILNVHASLLPRWRGAAPIIHTLLHGENKAGVSIMRIHPLHFDVGEIVKQKEIEINDHIFQPELHDLLADVGSETLMDCLYNLPTCLDNALPQDASQASYAPKVKQSLGKINWLESSAVEIYNLSRALFGVYPLLTKFKNYSLKLYKVQIWNEQQENPLKKPPGFIEYIKDKNVIRVWCGDGGSLIFDSVRVSGKKVMTAADFKNGYMKGVPEDQLIFKNV